MKLILTLVTLLALTLPGRAQITTPAQASGLGQKGVQLSPQASYRISLNRGLLLQRKGNFQLSGGLNLSGYKGKPTSATEAARLYSKGYERPTGANLKWGLGYKNIYARPQVRDNGRASGSLLGNNRSSFFRGTGRKSSFDGYVRPIVRGVDSFVREELTYHFAWLGGANGLTVKDALAKDSWSLRMACRPKVKQESPNRYTAQVACYGRLGWSQQQLPVVVQFTLLGADKKWKVHGQPTIVSANRITRPGHSVMANVWAEEPAPSAVDNAIEAAGTQVSQ